MASLTSEDYEKDGPTTIPQDGRRGGRRRPWPGSRRSSGPRPWARTGPSPPSDRIVMAGIGFGMMGPGNMAELPREARGPVGGRLRPRHGAPGHGQGHGRQEVRQQGLRDLPRLPRALLCARTSTPSRSPCPTTGTPSCRSRALRAGLDVYGEKPLTHNLREGRALCDAVKRYGRVWQTGSWQRSVENFHQACELVRNGRIGKIKGIEVGLPSGHYDFAGTFGQEALVPPPPNLDYESWVGPAP